MTPLRDHFRTKALDGPVDQVWIARKRGTARHLAYLPFGENVLPFLSRDISDAIWRLVVTAVPRDQP